MQSNAYQGTSLTFGNKCLEGEMKCGDPFEDSGVGDGDGMCPSDCVSSPAGHVSSGSPRRARTTFSTNRPLPV